MSGQPRTVLLSTATLLVGVCLWSGSRGTAVEFRTAILRNHVVWLTNYDEAYAKAKRENKLLLVYFDPHSAVHTAGLKSGLADDSIDPQLVGSRNRELIGDYVFARLSLDVTYWQGNRQLRLIDHPAYSELRSERWHRHHRPGPFRRPVLHVRRQRPTTVARQILPFPAGVRERPA